MEFLVDLFITCAFAVTIAMVWWLHKPVPLGVAALGAAFGFFVYRAVLASIGGIFFPTLGAAVIIGCSAEWFARKTKTPAIVLMAPGLYTLVPGSRMYETMLYFVQKNYPAAIDKSLEVALIAGGIAFGVLIASLFSLSVRRMRRVNQSQAESGS